jgi:2-polyprenyl-3-methyl-5-hydroxy-6-metoxy-1,4-benzoquinol methylase
MPSLLAPLKSVIHRAGRAYIARICSSEAASQTFVRANERPIEYSFALRCLASTQPRRVLDVGTGTTAWPHLLRNCGYVVRAIDNVRDYWPSGMVNRHWVVEDVDILRPDGFSEQFDAITCISVIEHIEDHVRAAATMARLLKPGGTLVLTTPYSHHHPFPNVYKHPDATWKVDLPYICRSSCATDLSAWMACGLHLERRELWRMFTGPVWRTGQPCDWAEATEEETHQLGCFAFRKIGNEQA